MGMNDTTDKNIVFNVKCPKCKGEVQHTHDDRKQFAEDLENGTLTFVCLKCGRWTPTADELKVIKKNAANALSSN